MDSELYMEITKEVQLSTRVCWAVNALIDDYQKINKELEEANIQNMKLNDDLKKANEQIAYYEKMIEVLDINDDIDAISEAMYEDEEE